MTDSWWLKVKRAQKHMIDLDRAIRPYIRSNPHEFVRVGQPDYKGEIWCKVRTTSQPDPILPFILGDFIHNLRTALDHIVVACVPVKHRDSASFPVVYEDIWAVDENGHFMVKDNERRQSFERAIREIDPRARAVIEQAQPYKYGENAFLNSVGILSRLDNADKHRDLVIVGSGVKNLSGTAMLAGRRVRLETTVPLQGDKFVKDGAVIVWKLSRNPFDGSVIKPSEMDMHFQGTTVAHFKASRLGGNEEPASIRLKEGMLHAISDVRLILRKLEPFVIR